MQIREFGRSRIPISALSFGSMRLDPQRTERAEAVRLFKMLHDGGLNTFHSSYEYDSFEYFCECLRAFREERPGAELRHIVKLPAPHFDEDRLSRQAFADRIDRYLKALDAERLDVVQWLVRQSPNSLEKRATVLADGREEMEELWSQLRKEGKVGALASFPYDPLFAEKALDVPSCEGLVTYLNLAELDYARFVDSTSIIAIRPLLAGLLTSEGLDSPREDDDAQRKHLAAALDKLGIAQEDATTFAIQFSLMHENVASAIVGVSSEEHARELLDAAESTHADGEEFSKIVDMLSPTTSTTC